MVRKKVLGIVVLYHPNINQVVRNINRYISDIDYLIIWINSAIDSNDNKFIKMNLRSSNYCIQHSKNNAGLSIPYNYALDYAEHNGYDLLMTMDQDSYWVDIRSYLEPIKILLTQKNNYGIFGPEIIPIEKSQNYCANQKKISCVDHVISSGAVYITKEIRKIGGFKSNYYIDAIDEEICYRAKNNGIETAKVFEGKLIQEFGNRTPKRILWIKTTTPNYSAMRYYYIVRNHIWLIKSKLINKNKRKTIIHNYIFSPLVKVILFESPKVTKLNSIFKGILDGIRGENR